MTILYGFDLLGTLVFAISGTLSAANKKLDLFGAYFIGFITAIGGGTLRDVILGNFPVGWISDINYLIVISIGVALTFLFKEHIMTLKRTLFLFDTIGIGVFTIIGIEKSLNLGIHPFLSIIMGLFSAVMGGVIRDTLCNDIPLIFRKEIYAVACLVGGILFIALNSLGIASALNQFITIACIIIIRIICIRFKISLPVLKY
ncbi:trimeric intracellular cation channel family protein [Labilibaculum sp. A4]|uniref:Trimeric intracellular cation channel family protein n=1 Tax=Labilibaculum euxinus TaxID=2686357 RepID=A0A425YGB9_9BACT|nr:trimeric intracellular cation channel family protein [Labilibaculum euxinus]MDQ1770299.1 trimeric intracellular cation channel family protein [Labilibaculum euxinus]MUP37978.1 trimeric intracellular cation channel family protein [Labilibaculum euxinus]MVB07183.1 trimeric intracellular cation channel family protein [Labilibaculum euxinus]MWN75482.1 trimeric intracellular cation channel family protein [Labilibaculum euxinus]